MRSTQTFKLQKLNIASPTRYRLLVVAMLALSACSSVSEWLARHHFIHHKTYTKIHAADFITELSSVTLWLDNGGELTESSESIDVIEQYTAQKHARPALVTVAVLEYQAGAEKYKTVIPFSNENYSALSDITDELDQFPHTLSEIRVFNITAVPSPPLRLKNEQTAIVLGKLEARQKTMLSSVAKLPALDEARLQLLLLRFFIDHKQKEGAYLCADNAKRLLAIAVRNKQDIEEDNQLTQELNELESQLRQEMPY